MKSIKKIWQTRHWKNSKGILHYMVGPYIQIRCLDEVEKNLRMLGVIRWRAVAMNWDGQSFPLTGCSAGEEEGT